MTEMAKSGMTTQISFTTEPLTSSILTERTPASQTLTEVPLTKEASQPQQPPLKTVGKRKTRFKINVTEKVKIDPEKYKNDTKWIPMEGSSADQS